MAHKMFGVPETIVLLIMILMSSVNPNINGGIVYGSYSLYEWTLYWIDISSSTYFQV